jgi:hypothetical protein
MLLNLDPSPKPTSTPSASTALPTETQRPLADFRKCPKTHLFRDPEMWEWTELRDYVIYEITRVTGEVSGHPTSSAAEAQIFKSFMKRHGANAQRIARYAMDTCDGFWYGSPVSIFDFCKNSDPQFADHILKSLEAAS